MGATIWKGQLTFGLVSIPARLVRAARAEKIKLHQLHREPRREAPAIQERQPDLEEELEPEPQLVPSKAATQNSSKLSPARASEDYPPPEAPRVGSEEPPLSRVRQTLMDPAENMPVPRSDLVRGFEFAKDRYVVIDPEDIRKITPQTSTEMQIVEFVRFAEIDPVYLETSYYLGPDEAGEKAYTLLFEAMRDSGYAALAQVSMHRREHVMILRPGRTGIVTHTMFYPDEVRTIQEFRTDVSTVVPKELNLAKMLIESLVEPFEPAKFKDSYRGRLQELIDGKVRNREVQTAARPVLNSKVVDIAEALQKSLEGARRKAPASQAEPTPRKNVKSDSPAPKTRERRSR